MTKQIRTENADNADYKVVVQTWDKGTDGAPGTLVDEQVLPYPTAMVRENTYITSTRYLVVKEAEQE